MPDQDSTSASAPALVVGLGNPLLGDDGLGWHIAEQLQRELCGLTGAIEVDCLSVGGLHLMERLVGYDRVILIDAVFTGQQAVGSLHCLSLDELPDLCCGHLNSSHDVSLRTAFQMGRALGIALPHDVRIVGVEAQRIYDFSEELTPLVVAAVPIAVQTVKDLLGQLAAEE
ncbi:MAG: hydrogenase maturation protease [Anaerolineae bacterium]|nr:hydrogenase maturation protease [Anaerolineae bacterium]